MGRGKTHNTSWITKKHLVSCIKQYTMYHKIHCVSHNTQDFTPHLHIHRLILRSPRQFWTHWSTTLPEQRPLRPRLQIEVIKNQAVGQNWQWMLNVLEFVMTVTNTMKILTITNHEFCTCIIILHWLLNIVLNANECIPNQWMMVLVIYLVICNIVIRHRHNTLSRWWWI